MFKAEDGIRDLVRSRGLGDVYKRQALATERAAAQKLNPVTLSGIPVDKQTLVGLMEHALSLIHI